MAVEAVEKFIRLRQVNGLFFSHCILVIDYFLVTCPPQPWRRRIISWLLEVFTESSILCPSSFRSKIVGTNLRLLTKILFFLFFQFLDGAYLHSKKCANKNLPASGGLARFVELPSP